MPSSPTIRVLRPLAANASANPLDVLKIKSALSLLGHYEAPDWGLSQFPEPALFKAIQAFQRQRGLQVDGVMKPGGPTEDALRAVMSPSQTDTALYATACTLQDMGRNGDTILAHITPDEAQLLHDITDGGSINPTTGLLEFWSSSRMGGSKHSREKRAEAENRAASATQEANGNPQSGDWSKERNRTLGYNDFNPGGLHGGLNRNGMTKQGEEAAIHERAVARNLAEQQSRIDAQRAKEQKAAAEQRQREEEAKDNVALARAYTATQQQNEEQPTGMLTKKAGPPPSAAPEVEQTMRASAPATPSPTQMTQKDTVAPEVPMFPGADPRAAPSATPAQQARNIEKARKLADQKAANVGEQPSTARNGQSTPTARFGAGPVTRPNNGPAQSRDWLSETISGFFGTINDNYIDATSWHFEDRDLLNSPQPKDENQAIKMGFERYPADQAFFHQNNIGKQEKKYGHPDGREVVFDGDTGKLATDTRYRGSYNYEVPSPMPDHFVDIKAWQDYLQNGGGHVVKDVAPYLIGGNVRGRY